MKGPSLKELLGDASDVDPDETEPEETEDEFPDGFMEAVGELRAADSDEEAAEALYAAIRSCKA